MAVSTFPDLDLQEQALKRRQALAQAIQEQGMQAPQEQIVGGQVVQHSPYEYLAKLGQTLIGSRMAKKGDEQSATLAGEKQKRLAAGLKGLGISDEQAAGVQMYPEALSALLKTDQTPQLLTPEQLPPGFTPAPNTRYFGQPGKSITKVEVEKPNDPPPTPAALQEYEYAKAQGFKGSYMDYVHALHPQAAPLPKNEVIQTDNGPRLVDKNTGKTSSIMDEGGAPVRPKLKTIPPAQNTAIIENSKALQNIDAAITAIDEAAGTPTTQGKDPNAMGARNYLPDFIRQRSDPSGVNVRAQVANIAGQRFHDVSGAAVSVSEASRLKPFIPSATDDAKTAREKLLNMRREYQNVQDMLGQTYSPEQGYSPSPILGGYQVQRVQ